VFVLHFLNFGVIVTDRFINDLITKRSSKGNSSYYQILGERGLERILQASITRHDGQMACSTTGYAVILEREPCLDYRN
jgi:hypothetical protein